MNPAVVLERLAVLAGRSWISAELTGGVNNSVWRVRSTDDGDPALDLVVRHWDAQDGLDHGVEVAAARAAGRVGAAAEVVEHRPDDRLVVFGHLPGRPLTASDLYDERVLARVVATLRRLHAEPADVPELDLLGRTTVPADVAAALTTDTEPLVLCHNDLVPENLLDDGERVALIDFEYAGLGEPAAELAGLAVGADLDPVRVARLTELYYGSPAPELVARVVLWQVVVRRLWSDWAREHGHDRWVFDG